MQTSNTVPTGPTTGSHGDLILSKLKDGETPTKQSPFGDCHILLPFKQCSPTIYNLKQYPLVIKQGTGKSPMNGGVDRKITDK